MRIAAVVAFQQGLWQLAFVNVDDHTRDLTADQRPESRRSCTGVDDGDIQNGVHLFAQRGDDEGDTTGFGFQQVTVGRLLLSVFWPG